MFRNQTEAVEYADTIHEHRERVFVQAALARAVGYLVKDPAYRDESTHSPFDLLRFAQVVHALVQNRDLVDKALSGRYSDFRQIPDQF